MERLLSKFRLRTSRRNQFPQSQPDNKEIGDPMAASQSTSPNTNGSEDLPNGDENIIQNPYYEDGLKYWSSKGCKILLHTSMGDGKIIPMHGRFFISATNRNQSWNGIQQDISGMVKRKVPYEVTAVVRILGDITTNVRAGLWVQAPDGREQYISIGTVQASREEWVRLEGRFLLNGVASKVVIYLEGPPMGTDILVNSLVVKHAKKLPSSPPPDIKNVQYGVNIIENSNLKRGLSGWSPVGSCNLSVCNGSPSALPNIEKDYAQHKLLSGLYISATNRTKAWMGPSQNIRDKVKPQLTYQVAAWVSVGSGVNGPQIVNITLKVDGRWISAGQVQAISDRWYEVGGAFRLETQPSEAMVYIAGPSPGVTLMVAGLHVFPVDRKARFKRLKEQTDKLRKRDVILRCLEPNGGNAEISVKVRQTRNSFPFGSHINRSLIENEEFVDYVVKNFNWAVFGNELKWYATEPEQGKYNYKDADELLDFCNKHGIKTRGHCIFWEVENVVQPWIRALNQSDLMIAVQNRLKGLLSRYKGKFKHHDVNNEMLHGSFFQDRLGEDIRAYMFREAHRLDPTATLFVNDYNVENGCDSKATPEMYVHQILDLQERGAIVGGIGLQGYIKHPVGEFICAALDKLAILGLPIWFTELTVAASNEHVRADDLEVILREAYAHPAIGGIVMWGHLELMCGENSHLIDADGEINEAGKRYLALKQEWLSHAHGNADAAGEFIFRGYHGEYTVEITTTSKTWSQSFIVEEGETPLVLTINL